jgi:hypothetical protein
VLSGQRSLTKLFVPVRYVLEELNVKTMYELDMKF